MNYFHFILYTETVSKKTEIVSLVLLISILTDYSNGVRITAITML